jgi:hypothetical protein
MRAGIPFTTLFLCTLGVSCVALLAAGQPGADWAPGPPPPLQFIPGPGGFGGPPREKMKLVKRFDTNGDGLLDAAERKAARDFVQKGDGPGSGRGRPGGRRFGPSRENQEPPQPGPRLSVTEVKIFTNAPLYEPQVLRTFFLQFESADWEKELADFKNSDVDVPATLTVDGKVYKDVGIHFRGSSSFMMVGEGRKRSLNVSLNYKNKEQEIGGYHTLNLLNSHDDPTFLRSVLSYQIDRDYIPAPRANLARVVINGESWGIYVNAQQFNKQFVKEWFGTTKGARWKVPGSPRTQAGLGYPGEDAAPYKRLYEIKSKDDPNAWSDLIRLCKVLNETPPNQLEEALAPILDVDGALKFLALENVLINNDGYWIRSSDYSIYQDTKGRFHIIPSDSNETFLRPESPRGPGPRGPRGPGPRPNLGGPGPAGFDSSTVKGVELDPLVAVNDSLKPLISKLLAIPGLRARYLAYARDIAVKWLDWKTLGPIASQYQALISADVKTDTRKLYSTEAFLQALQEDAGGDEVFERERRTISLKSFAEQRRAYLLKPIN